MTSRGCLLLQSPQEWHFLEQSAQWLNTGVTCSLFKLRRSSVLSLEAKSQLSGKIRGKLFYKKKLFLSFWMSRKCQLNYDPRTYLLCREGNAAEGNVNPDIAPLSTLYPPSCNLKLYLQNRFCFYASALSVREGSIYFSSKRTSPLVWTPSHPHSLYWTNLDSNSHSILHLIIKGIF